MDEPIISVSGLRGIVGQSLDPIIALRYVAAYVGLINQDGPIVVTRDGRTTGEMLAQAICAGIRAVGRDVLYGDIAATPTTGVLVRGVKAAGGIQISASHNPSPYNGIKLFGGDGRVVSATEGEQVVKQFRDGKINWAAHDRVGKIDPIRDTVPWHLEAVLRTVNAPAIRAAKFKVVLDSHHGAGSLVGKQLLESLNCQFEALGDEPDGLFEHPPEPTAANLQSTINRAVEFGADAVFCQDPDADRLAIIDEKGNYIGEEYTLAIALNHVLSLEKGPVVINCSSSRMSADICAAHGCELHLSAVGEANVTNEMMRVGAVYGGEGNGGPIDPRVGYVRDSFVAMAQVLDAMAATGKTISQLVAEIPPYQICKTVIEIDRDKISLLFESLEKRFPEAAASHLDGLRLDWPESWMLVRPSNTEPIVRAIAEAKTMDAAKELCGVAAELAESV